MAESPLYRNIQREHVLQAIEDYKTGATTPYQGEPTKYLLRIENGDTYPCKPIVALAYRRMSGHFPTYLSAGWSTTQAQGILDRLNFEIIDKDSPAPPVGGDWSQQEVRVIVTDYFDMLREELLGHRFNKSEHRARLKPLLGGRSDGSIEFKHQNISAVLLSLGQPYVAGYKPRGNYQDLLANGVERYLADHADFFDRVVNGPVLSPSSLPILPSLASIFDTPPDEIISPPPAAEPWKSRRGRRTDFVRRDAENRELGKLGEQFAVELERRRLKEQRRDDLAAKVEWAAQKYGDGLGFDVLSFSERDDGEKYLEVKTTGLGKDFPFIVTANEVRCSEAEPNKFHLYRVFNFSHDPRVYILQGKLAALCQLQPLTYRATIESQGE